MTRPTPIPPATNEQIGQAERRAEAAYRLAHFVAEAFDALGCAEDEAARVGLELEGLDTELGRVRELLALANAQAEHERKAREALWETRR